MVPTQEQRDGIVDTFEKPYFQRNQAELSRQPHRANLTKTLSSSSQKKANSTVDRLGGFLQQSSGQESSYQAGAANSSQAADKSGHYEPQRNFAQNIHTELQSKDIEGYLQLSVEATYNEAASGMVYSQTQESKISLENLDNEETLGWQTLDPVLSQPSPRLISIQSQDTNTGVSTHRSAQEFVQERIQRPPPIPLDAVATTFSPLYSEDDRDWDALEYKYEQRGELYESRDVSAQPSSTTFFSQQCSEAMTTTPFSSVQEFREEVRDRNTPSQATSSTQLSQNTAEKLVEYHQQRPRREALHERELSDPLSIFTSLHTGLPQKEVHQRPEAIVRISGDNWVLVTPTKNLSLSQEKTTGRIFSRFLKVGNEENARRMQKEDIRFPQDDLGIHPSLEQKKMIVQQLLEQRGEEQARREVYIPEPFRTTSNIIPSPGSVFPDIKPSDREPRIPLTEEDRLLGRIWLNGKTKWSDFNRRTRELIKRFEQLNKVKITKLASSEPAVAPPDRGKTEMESNLIGVDRAVDHVEGQFGQGNTAGEQLDIEPVLEIPEMSEHPNKSTPKREASKPPSDDRDSRSSVDTHTCNPLSFEVKIKGSWINSLAEQVEKNYRQHFQQTSHFLDFATQHRTGFAALREKLENQHCNLRTLLKKKIWVVIAQTKHWKPSKRKVIGSVFINMEVPGARRARFEHLVVRRRWGNIGLEEKLLKKAISLVRAEGYNEVYFAMLGTFNDKNGAMPPYENLGFRKETSIVHEMQSAKLEETILVWREGYDPYGPKFSRCVDSNGNPVIPTPARAH
ncbi:hypothetical protein BGZ60DRAFT_563474 [Tricladium varicosporioides]|nr:hypothetical protein BGZ60DRAFT_563474 [Hymenoscyphus varicosporioides]